MFGRGSQNLYLIPHKNNRNTNQEKNYFTTKRLNNILDNN